MIQLSREESVDPLAMLTQPVTFLASLMLGHGFPSTYGLDCFVFKDFKSRFSLLLSVGIVEHYC
jgi:hypothetical protein